MIFYVMHCFYDCKS